MGVYRTVYTLGRGGMATVHLARQEGLGGFQKLVVVKRICDSLSFDPVYADLFLDEARLAAQLQHPNIVQITDIGRDEKGLFMVMEYLEGESLAYIQDRLACKSTTLDSAFVCRVGTSLAAGLQHAHTATNSRGHSTPVIHRDVTPSNIIVCYNGVVKLVDFGIAKSEGRTTEKTKTGQVRGKVPYMAPEQVLEEPVTPATDVFQLGIVLHEMLTNVPLFRRNNMHQSAMALMHDEIKPPSVLRPSAPKLLDDVVMQALERDPANRQPSAEVLRQQLEQAAQQIGPITGEYELSRWMQEEFADRFAKRRAMAREALSTSVEGVGAALNSRGVAAKSADIILDTDTLNISGEGRSTPGHTASLAHVIADAQRSGSSTQPPKRSLVQSMLWSLVTVAMALAAFLAFQAFERPGSEPLQPPEVSAAAPKSFPVRVDAVPTDAVISLDHREVAIGRLDRELSKRPHPYLVTVSAEDHLSQEFTVFDATEKVVTLEPRRQPDLRGRSSNVVARKQRSVARKPGSRRHKPATRADRDAERSLATDLLDPWSE